MLLRTLAGRRRDLEDVQYEIKTQGLDGVLSRLTDDALVGAQLTALLRGTLTAGAYWDRWRAAQIWAEGGAARSSSSATLSRPRGSANARLTTAA